MKGDFTRFSYKAEKHFSSVRMQQGRPQLDSDWNEQSDIQAHRHETGGIDTIGGAGVPLNAPGFGITLTPDESDLAISAGRLYLDGLLVENDAPSTYSAQASGDFPKPPAIRDLLNQYKAKLGLVYLDVWQRHITALEDPSIREVALGGPDTTTRVKNVWQVRVLPIVGDASYGAYYHTYALAPKAGEVSSCGVTDSEWAKFTASPARTLSARVKPTASSSNACELVPRSGYQRLENQLYRVEVHQPGDLNTATFKWSRENGSVVTAWVGQNGNDLRVSNSGKDASLGFAAGDWVELTDDTRELQSLPGLLVQVSKVDGNVLSLLNSAGAKLSDFPQNPKVRRWEQKSDTGDIKISIPATNDGFLVLEGGIEVKFAGSSFQTGDYWTIPARAAMTTTEVGGIDWPRTVSGDPIGVQPSGVVHHYYRLATIRPEGDSKLKVLSDCRKFFNTLTGITDLLAPPHTPVINDIRMQSAYPLRNGALITAQELSAGFRVFCSEPMLQSSLQGAIVCYITVYLPYVPPTFSNYGGSTISMPAEIVGSQPLILTSTIEPDRNNASNFDWIPSAGAARWLQTAFQAMRTVGSLPARLTIKGSWILPNNATGGPLDADMFANANGTRLPSGDGFVGGDLDFFFNLVDVRPAYAYMQRVRLKDFQPVVFQGIGSQLV